MLTKKEKEKVVGAVRIHETDTGSPESQVALLTEEIRKLLSHLKKHPKDFHSKRGLLKMVGQRRALLRYLQRENDKRYKTLIKKLGLKK